MPTLIELSASDSSSLTAIEGVNGPLPAKEIA